MSSRTFFLMFEVEDGGVSNPVKWSKDSLKSENIVMVLDEENMSVWLWFGAKRGLVSKRTALRQAQSLKGHGYEIGRSIVGRGLDSIHEIDERKIGRDPETDELNVKFMDLVSRTMHEAGGFVVTTTAGGEPLPIEEHFKGPKPIEMEVIQPKAPATINPEPSPAPASINPVPSPAPASINPVPSPAPASINPVPSPAPASINPVPSPAPASINPVPSPAPASINPVPSPAPASINPVPSPAPASINPVPSPAPVSMDPQPSPAPITDGPPTIASEYAEVSVPQPPPLPLASDKDSLLKGVAIIAVLSEFKDLWVSRLDESTIALEYMEGPIARFHINGGEIAFEDGSFDSIDPASTSNIMQKIKELKAKLV